MSNSIKLDLPSSHQIVGPDRLQIFDKIGVKALPTEYAKLRGSDDIYATKTPKTNSSDNDEIIVCGDWMTSSSAISSRHIGVRPMVQYSEICDICHNERAEENGVLIVDCGMYPDKILDESKSYHENQKKDLEELPYFIYTKNGLHGNRAEHIYKNKKGVGLYTDTFAWDSSVTSTPSVRRIFDCNEYVAALQPVEWLVDEKSNIAIAKNIITAGIEFDIFEPIYNSEEEFENTLMYKYLNQYLAREIFQFPEEVTTGKVLRKK